MLGGIGPEASALFYTKLINKLQENMYISENTDYPQIIINSIPAPELTSESINDETLTSYYNGIMELSSLKVDNIVMICNTIHIYYEKLQRKTLVPILDLRKAVAKELTNKNIKKALLIGTKLTVKNKLYSAQDVDIITPEDEELDKITNAIICFNRGENKPKQIEIVKSVCEKYIKKGAEIIIAGCTEFAVMLNSSKIPIIDTIDVLVSLSLEAISQGRKK